MRTESNIRLKIIQFIGDNFLLGDHSKLKDEDSLMEKGIVDSTGILELVSFIEESFDFKVADEELFPDNLDSVNKLVKFVNKKIN